MSNQAIASRSYFSQLVQKYSFSYFYTEHFANNKGFSKNWIDLTDLNSKLSAKLTSNINSNISSMRTLIHVG